MHELNASPSMMTLQAPHLSLIHICRLESDHAHHGGDDRVSVVRRGRGQKALHAGEHLGVCVGKPRAELTRRVLVIKHGKTRAKFPRLLFDEDVYKRQPLGKSSISSTCSAMARVFVTTTS